MPIVYFIIINNNKTRTTKDFKNPRLIVLQYNPVVRTVFYNMYMLVWLRILIMQNTLIALSEFKPNLYEF